MSGPPDIFGFIANMPVQVKEKTTYRVVRVWDHTAADYQYRTFMAVSKYFVLRVRRREIVLHQESDRDWAEAEAKMFGVEIEE